jgi:hypothetical protein
VAFNKKKQCYEVMPAPFPSWVGYFGPRVRLFREAFAGKGRFMRERY